MQRITRGLSTLLTILSLSFYAMAQTAPKKLVIVGDSITEGYGVSREQAYPTILQQKIEQSGKSWLVINSGISGSTSASAPSRVAWTIKQKPQIILIALGGNDGLRGHPAKSIEENLTKAIELCKKAGVTVLLAGVPLPPNYGQKYRHEFEKVFVKVANKTNTPLIPSILAGVAGQSSLNLPDGIHPNERGHMIIADALFEVLKKYL